MADVAALQTKLQTLGRLAAGLEQDRVTMGVTVELLQGRLLQGGTAAGASVAAGGAEGVEAGGTRLQQAQEQHGALAGQAGQSQAEAGVCGRSHSEKQDGNFSNKYGKRGKKHCQAPLKKKGLTIRLTLN